MGTFSVTIEIGDPGGQRFEHVVAKADTGAVTTMIPGSMLQGLGVVPSVRDVFEYANGEQAELYMGETKIRIGDRETTSWVKFGEEGTDPLLGAYTLEGLRLGVDPYAQRLITLDRPLPLK